MTARPIEAASCEWPSSPDPARQPARSVHDLPLTCAGAEAASAFNDTVRGYLKYRADTAQHMGRALAADPGFALAHVLKGYFAMLSFKQANVPMAQEALATANGLMGTASRRREQAHAAGAGALGRWRSSIGTLRNLGGNISERTRPT